MSRINTNVTSLVAQNILGRSNAALEQALNRLSTGLRINTGKDDPAGLIASENLRSDIASIQKAISNTERANQVIATADSALGQVSSLLTDIRGLVTESANNGALSEAQIAANQLQLDESLAALNRMTVDALRARYAEVFGEPTNGRHKQWLVKRIIWRMQSLASRGLMIPRSW